MAMPRHSDPFPIPDVPGETPEQRFKRVMKGLIAVPKSEVEGALVKPASEKKRRQKGRNELPEIDKNWKKPDWLDD
jgi:hypothetical protein